MTSHTTTADGTPIPVRLADYRPPAFLIETTALVFDIRTPGDVVLTVTSRFRRNPAPGAATAFELLGHGLSLVSLKLDDRLLRESADYAIADETLTIFAVPDSFTLEVVTALDPQMNESGAGLYVDKDGTLLTQCEAAGFRQMTWFPDRPDVMATYTTTIVCRPDLFPVLLSNGNIAGDRIRDDGKREIVYADPFPKPCYLFAMIAADLDHITGDYKTLSGRTVDLEVYVPKGKSDQATIALESLQRAMKWDEDRFGLECDVDRYVILSTDTFNMGGMENKGLNVFNSVYLLARPDLTTDIGIIHVEGVIGHEYFHNWTGNRITCRDWFQITLKEGLTVYRDQEFSAEMNSPVIQRIMDVRRLRGRQFLEDSGPTAHPIRPESYAAVDNLYTITVYFKGAEIIRMLATLVGRDGFRKGMDLYFARHDGQAVTCDDFVAAIVDANAGHVSFDVAQFKLWYSQAGTPEVTASSSYDEAAQSWTLHLRQAVPATPGQAVKQPMLIPIALGLLDGAGNDMPIGPGGETQIVLQLTEAAQDFTFTGIGQKPVPSLLRNFSAPVRLKYDYGDDELAFLMSHDSDGFNRWDAAQRLGAKAMLAGLTAQRQGSNDAAATPEWRDMKRAMLAVIADAGLDPAAKADMLILPTILTLGQDMDEVDYAGLYQVRVALMRDFAAAHKSLLLDTYRTLDRDAGSLDIGKPAMANRALKSVILGYLARLEDAAVDALILAQAARAPSAMTDVIAALGCLADRTGLARDQAFAGFLEHWRGESGPVNSWFSLQAMAVRPDTLAKVQGFLDHPLFDAKNPNLIRAVIGAFSSNPVMFHAADGSGYEFFADRMIAIDAYNPTLAGHMVEALLPPANLAPALKALAQEQLKRIAAAPGISPNTSEIVHMGLASA